MLPVLDPIPKGIAVAIWSVAVTSVGGALFALAVPAPSPQFFGSLAIVGAGLLVAYVVEAVWLLRRAEADEDYEEWLGFVIGAGLAGFLGVIVALLIAEHRLAGHDNLLDQLGLGWAAASLVILGLTLILQPLLAERYGSAGRD